MKKIIIIISIICLPILFFAVSILFVEWWDMPPLQVYIPPKTPSQVHVRSESPLFNIRINGKEGCMDRQGKILIQPGFDEIRCSNEDLIPFFSNNSWGFINQAGVVILEPQFYINPLAHGNYFREGLGVVCQNRKCGYIDEKTGSYVIEPEFNSAENFFSGSAKVYTAESDSFGNFRFSEGRNFFINRQGALLFEKSGFFVNARYSDNLIKVRDNDGRLGFIDAIGNFAVPPQGSFVSEFAEGLAVISNDQTQRQGYIDTTGKIVIPQQFKNAWEFSEGLAKVRFENDKYGYIDKTGQTVFETEYEFSQEFHNGRAEVSVGRLYGFIDKTGKLVIPLQFGSAERFVNGLAQISFEDQNEPYEKTKWGYIDTSGKVVWQPTN